MRSGLLAIVLVFPLCSSALNAQSGKTGFAFLKIGMGARMAALAGSAAEVRGAEATYWNPAGLSGAPNEVHFSHTAWLLDISNDFVAVKFAGFGGALGVSLTMQNVGGIMQRTVPSAEPLAEVTAHDVAFGISYARELSPGFHAGATLKYVGERIVNHGSNGFAFDLGARRDLGPDGRLAIAASIHNLGSAGELAAEALKLPTYVRAGIAFTPLATSEDRALRLLAGVDALFDGPSHFAVGAELVPRERIAVRAGLQTGNESFGLAGGFGFATQKFRLDYAFAPAALDLGGLHRFSFALGL